MKAILSQSATRLQLAAKITEQYNGKVPIMDIEDIFGISEATLRRAHFEGKLKLEGSYLLVDFDLSELRTKTQFQNHVLDDDDIIA